MFNKFKVGDKVRRFSCIDGFWSEKCAKHDINIHGIHTVAYVNSTGGIGFNDAQGKLIGDWDYDDQDGVYTFDPNCFELIERHEEPVERHKEPVIVECDSNIIAIVTKDRVVINNIAYPVNVIKNIAAALDSIE